MLVNRREAMAATTLLAASGSAAPIAVARQPIAAAGVTSALVDFVTGLSYDRLPATLVTEAKRYLLDAIGCGLAGNVTDKGRLAAEFVEKYGGRGKSTLLGRAQRLGAPAAAFANAELINALDFDGVPHIPPVAVAPLLAVGEERQMAGRAFLTSLVAAHELAWRLWRASSRMAASIAEDGHTPNIFSVNQEAVIGTAAAIAGMLQLDARKTASAIGLAAYYCPPPSSHEWETYSPKTNVKYNPVGLVAQNAVTAALLAESGFSGSPAVLDGEAGFPVFYGWPSWKPDLLTARLGEDWHLATLTYKPHACCGFIHSQLDCMEALVARHGIRPDEIESIRSLSMPFVANPDQRTIRTQEDAQFSIPYMLAVAAHDLPTDATCQLPARLADPALRATMTKIRWEVHPDAQKTKLADPNSFIAKVEIRVRGTIYVEERRYARGGRALPLSMAEIEAKFLRNAELVISPEIAQRILDSIMNLERLDDISRIFI